MHSDASSRWQRAIVAVVALVLFGAIADAGDAVALYGPVADALQSQTHGRFWNGTYYRENNGGNENFNYWWNAHGLDALTDASRRTRQPVYTQRMKTLLHGILSANGGTYLNTFYDDMEWLGLASLRAYELTGDQEYLDVAELLWSDIKGGLSDGAFSWNKNCRPGCKNTIANTPAIILGARLHAWRASPQDFQMVQSVYAFVKARLVDPATGAVWDGLDPATGTVNKKVFSYNQGMFIGAGLELYKLTRNAAYLDDALKTVSSVLDSQSPNGMLFGGETGGRDGGLFKGILVRYLALLAREGDIPAATRVRIINAIKQNANILNSIGIHRPEMICGTNWAVQAGTTTDYSTQLSGLMLMETAASIEMPVVYQHRYRGRSTPLPVGSYTTAALAARGVANNDITSLTVPPGATLTLFDGDNFTGASLVKTDNDFVLSDDGWNDRTSSIVVAAPVSTDSVTLFGDCTFKGYAVGLPLGSYTMGQLQARGVVNDDISSIRVKSGFQIKIFENFDLTGRSLVITANDDCLVDNGFNDGASSVIVSRR
jgi:predicted alpha-1,6-mannanase (GH76 family)